MWGGVWCNVASLANTRSLYVSMSVNCVSGWYQAWNSKARNRVRIYYGRNLLMYVSTTAHSINCTYIKTIPSKDNDYFIGGVSWFYLTLYKNLVTVKNITLQLQSWLCRIQISNLGVHSRNYGTPYLPFFHRKTIWDFSF